MSKIFISHSSANNAEARALAVWLEKNGWDDYFLDVDPHQGLAPGERWQDALKLAAGRCEAVLFLISPVWLGSSYCKSEFLLAKHLGKKIFGVLIKPASLDDLPKEMTAEWQLCDLVAGAERSTFTVRDGVVPDSEVSFAAAGLARLKIGLKKAGIDATTFPWPPAHDPERAPYRGLRPLEADDAAVFFGRDVAITRGLDELRSVRERGVEGMLVILGASGAGKSSYLRAGLWPRLTRDDRNFLPLPVIRPQAAAMTGPGGLVASLDRAFRERKIARSRAEIRSILRSSGGFSQLVSELQTLAQQPFGLKSPVPTVLVAIDQGEELFVSDGREENDELLAILTGALGASLNRTTAEAHRSIAVVAIRSDAYDRLQSEPRLATVTQRPFNLPPIARGEFKEIVTGPAQRAAEAGRKLHVEPALTERLLQDAEGADALPLLAFVLERLYVDYGGDGVLSIADYDALGGVRGAIEAAVKAAFADHERAPVIPLEETACERLLRKAFIPWLAGVDSHTGERRRRVARLEEIPSDSAGVIERLINARLLIRDRRKVEGESQHVIVVEVAHEALLRQWPALTRWLDQDADALKAVEAVRRAADEWAKKQNAVAWLVHTGERLEAAERWRERPDLARLLGAEGHAYLNACRAKDAAARAKEDAARAERETLLQKELEATHRLAQEQEARAREAELASYKLRRRERAVVAFAFACLALAGGVLYFKLAADREFAAARDSSIVVLASAVVQHDPTEAVLLLSELRDPQGTDGALNVAMNAARNPLAHLSLKGHTQRILRVAFSADGTRVVTTSDDGTARVWPVDGVGSVITLKGHTSPVLDVAFSADSTHIVTASGDSTARVWRADGTGKPVTLTGHRDVVWTAAFIPHDSARVVTASRDGTVRVWLADGSGEAVTVPGPIARATSATFSLDGMRVATTSSDGTASVWRTDGTGAPVMLKGHTGAVLRAAFNANGTRVVTASQDRTARVWHADGSGGEIILEGHTGAVLDAAFNRNGTGIVTASEDGTARVWPIDAAESGGLSGERGAGIVLRSSSEPVLSAVFSPEGTRVLTASADGTAHVWRANGTGKLIRLQHASAVDHAVFSPDGNRIATGSGDTARVWSSTRTGGISMLLQGHAGAVVHAAFSAKGTRIVTASDDRTARVWPADGSGTPSPLEAHSASVVHAAFGPDDTHIVTVADHTAHVWRTDAPGAFVTLAEHTERVRRVNFSVDGIRIATASDDRTARIWRADGTGPPVILQHNREVFDAAFSRDGTRIVTASQDGFARVWRADGAPTSVALRHTQSVIRALFSGDGNRILTASTDGNARVWPADGGGDPIVLPAYASLEGFTPAGIDVDFSRDGTLVLVKSDDGIRVWRADGTGAPLTLPGVTRQGVTVPVTHAAFSPNGTLVVSTNKDGTARISRVDGMDSPLVLQEHSGEITHGSFSPDGNWVVTASRDKTARVWPVNAQILIDYLRRQTRDCLSSEERQRLLAESAQKATAGVEACKSR